MIIGTPDLSDAWTKLKILAESEREKNHFPAEIYLVLHICHLIAQEGPSLPIFEWYISSVALFFFQQFMVQTMDQNCSFNQSSSLSFDCPDFRDEFRLIPNF